MAGHERIEADIIAQPPIIQANIKTRAPRIESDIVTAGGTADYTQLINLPFINGTQIIGSLAGIDFNLATIYIDTTAGWDERLPLTSQYGVIYVYSDIPAIKIGDGTSDLSALPFIGGGNEDAHFTYTQTQLSDTWLIVHNLNKYPSVSVVDTANTQVVGDVEYIDTNTVRVTFGAAFAGSAYLN